MTQKKKKATSKQPTVRVRLTNKELPFKQENTNRELWMLLLGTVLGVALTLIANLAYHWITESAERKNVANMLRGLVEKELEISVSLAEDLRKQKAENQTTVSSSYDWLHDSALINSVAPQVGMLESEIVREYAEYAQMVNQCRSLKEAYQDALKIHRNRVRDTGVFYEGYLKGLETLEEYGNRVLKAIDKNYPE